MTNTAIPAGATCLYDVYLSDPYSDNNPDGIIDLSTAENHLLADRLVPEIERCTDLKQPSALSYEHTGGSATLKSAFKDFMVQISTADIDESRLTMVSGAEIAIQILLQAICKPGDKVATITPCYTGFIRACGRLGLDIKAFTIALDAEMEIPDLPKDIRVVLISNPDVPTGRCWSRHALQNLIEAVKANGQHLIVDEVVSTAALSETNFISSSPFVDDHIHVISALSKIGMAGLRIGAIYSGLPRALVTDLSRVAQIGSIEQILTAKLLRNQPFIANLLDLSRTRLRDAYAIAADRLHAERIDFLLGSAGLTVLLNLGAGISAESIVADSKVYVRDLAEFGLSEAGWFRMTLSVDRETVASAIQRLGHYLRRRSPLSLLPSYTNRFKGLWERTETLWAVLQVNDKWSDSRPIQLRHPFVFYVGHLPAFAINQICLALGEENIKRANAEFDKLFARGIDPDVISGEVHPHSADVNHSSWPAISEIFRYAKLVHELVQQSLPMLLTSGHSNIAEMILEHEQMHQETLVYMMAQCEPSELQFSHAAANGPLQAPTIKQRACQIPSGNAVLGRFGSPTIADRFAWDNEFPQVTVHVDGFDVMALPVSNGDYLKFIECGGYSNPALWSERHWQWLRTDSISHPAFWRYKENSRQWFVRTSLFEYLPLEQVLDYPVMVSYAEASAFCRYADGRIMTEAEYHRAAYGDNVNQPYPWGFLPPKSVNANVDFQSWSLRPSGVGNTESCFNVADLVGQAWEWTSTVFSPLDATNDFATMPTYTGYSSEFFDGKHIVMKGGSWATDQDLLRPSFRNWYQDCYHYAFAKFRLVVDKTILNGLPEENFTCLMERVDLEEQKFRFYSSIKSGLLSTPKHIHSMHFYDDRGSEIYAKITELNEYYLTRTESGILNKFADEIANLIQCHLLQYKKRRINVVEFGAGDGKKTIPLLNRLSRNSVNLRYYPIDISEGALRSLKKKLILNNSDFTSHFILGDNIQGLEYLSNASKSEALTVVLFLGSSIGNYGRAESSRLMKAMRSNLSPGDIAIIGFDLVKSTDTLLPAYDDRQGITAEFNYNLIRRLNKELDARIPPDAFRHYATFNPIERRMESYLIPSKQLDVTFSMNDREATDFDVVIDAWEPIHVENSHKYTLKDIEEFCVQSGFQISRNLLDEQQWFSDTIFYVP